MKNKRIVDNKIETQKVKEDFHNVISGIDINKKDKDKPYVTYEDYEKRYFTKEEVALMHFETELFGILHGIKKQKNVTQKDIEKMSGVSQPVVSRLLNRKVDSNISTLLKVLLPLGYTIKIVPLKK